MLKGCASNAGPGQALKRFLMASQWHSLVSQKLFLARTLLDSATDGSSQPVREATAQGSIELMLRARALLLIMVADFYQHKDANPGDPDQLAALIGEDRPEIAMLEQLQQDANSWWSGLDQLAHSLSRPAAKRKTVSADNIIAVSAEAGPDRSTATLNSMATAMKAFADTVAERHNEW
ncbi:DUF6586 family protein [Marinobacter xestospongiae]|uniref:DUF6586 family protein n=1 Tax=Marinobacter xestospongiae TaxID=994319 RepID=UPI002004E0CA|nr:DUF6586 family protein [Marinobacter xestospongiae]MCK7566536.1 hypothetical protein [Marinobacter xestospongiae]